MRSLDLTDPKLVQLVADRIQALVIKARTIRD